MFADIIADLANGGEVPPYLIEAFTYRYMTHRSTILADEKLLSEFLQVCFATNNTPLIAEIAHARFGFPARINISDLARCHLMATRLIITNGAVEFQFWPQPFGPHLPILISRWLGLQDLYAGLVDQSDLNYIINFDDCGNGIGLNFCDTDDVGLIPDPYFLGSHGYDHARGHFSANPVHWLQRQDTLFWRGSTTGQRIGPVDELPRVKLCRLAQAIRQADVALSEFVQITPEEAESISDLWKGYVPWTDLANHRYHIDIDGNTNSWPGLMLKLLSGGLVFKVKSPFGFRQWYYDRLCPGINFISIREDLADLPEALEYFRSRPSKAAEIAANGQRLAMAMTYERELAVAIETAKHFRAP